MCLGGSVLSVVEFVYILLSNVFGKKRKRTPLLNIYLNELLRNKRVFPNKAKVLNANASVCPANFIVKSRRSGKKFATSKQQRY